MHCTRDLETRQQLLITYLSLALDLRPPLKPLAVPRECSTRILKANNNEDMNLT